MVFIKNALMLGFFSRFHSDCTYADDHINYDLHEIYTLSADNLCRDMQILSAFFMVNFLSVLAIGWETCRLSTYCPINLYRLKWRRLKATDEEKKKSCKIILWQKIGAYDLYLVSYSTAKAVAFIIHSQNGISRRICWQFNKQIITYDWSDLTFIKWTSRKFMLNPSKMVRTRL